MKLQTKSIMTKNLVTIPVGSPVRAACDLMAEKRIRHLPVTESDGTVVGILSQRSLNSLQAALAHLPVECLMSTPVIAMDQNAPLRLAIFKFLENKISSLLLTDDQDNVVGIITTDDLLGYLCGLLGNTKHERFSVRSLMDLQTLGEIARQISEAGI